MRLIFVGIAFNECPISSSLWHKRGADAYPALASFLLEKNKPFIRF
jgi:hypothetical protein